MDYASGSRSAVDAVAAFASVHHRSRRTRHSRTRFRRLRSMRRSPMRACRGWIRRQAACSDWRRSGRCHRAPRRSTAGPAGAVDASRGLTASAPTPIASARSVVLVVAVRPWLSRWARNDSSSSSTHATGPTARKHSRRRVCRRRAHRRAGVPLTEMPVPVRSIQYARRVNLERCLCDTG